MASVKRGVSISRVRFLNRGKMEIDFRFINFVDCKFLRGYFYMNRGIKEKSVRYKFCFLSGAIDLANVSNNPRK